MQQLETMMSDKKKVDTTETHFKLVQITNLSELKAGSTLPTSDLCFQDDNKIYQFKLMCDNKSRVLEVIPGAYLVAYRDSGELTTIATKLHARNMLHTLINTTAIKNSADKFFSKLHIYEELNEPKIRRILLYGEPGCGKTAAINSYCNDLLQSDTGTVVLIWSTDSVHPEDMSQFISKKIQFMPNCKRLILVIEDIGGGEQEGSSAPRSVSSSLLALLDGIEVQFVLPTLIIATTNFPQNMLQALADRPGRFDLVMEMKLPTLSEKIDLMQFLLKGDIDKTTKQALKDYSSKFSLAHIKETVLRSLLDDKPLATCIRELHAHQQRFQRAFQSEDNTLGF